MLAMSCDALWRDSLSNEYMHNGIDGRTDTDRQTSDSARDGQVEIRQQEACKTYFSLGEDGASSRKIWTVSVLLEHARNAESQLNARE